MPSRLTYLKINKFRHVKPGSVIEFRPGFNVVVGQNGAGKTTLLKLISGVLRNNISEFARESFSLDFRINEGVFRLDATLENTYSKTRARTTLSGAFTCGDKTYLIESNDSESQITFEGHTVETQSVVPSKAEFDVSYTPVAAALTALLDTDLSAKIPAQARYSDPFEAVSHPFVGTRLTEGTETFNGLFTSVADEENLPGLGVALIKAPQGTTVFSYNLRADDILLNLTDTEQSDAITLGTKLGPLLEFVHLSQYEDARLILVKTDVTSEPAREILTFANPLARFRTPGGNEVPHDHLSFGEKRLLTFLLKLYAHKSTIIVDELANGMHHSWLERCVELLDDFDTQAFLTSQNPLLLDCLPLSRETYATSHTLVICELTESGEMVWRNLSDAESEDFFKSLDVGLQHVSEIMRAKGLW